MKCFTVCGFPGTTILRCEHDLISVGGGQGTKCLFISTESKWDLTEELLVLGLYGVI